MSTGWSPDGPATIVPAALGWSVDGPTDPTPDPVHGWTPEHWTTAGMSGDGQLIATAFYRPTVFGVLAGDGQATASAMARPFTTPTLTGDGQAAAAAWSKAHTPPESTAGDGILTAAAAFPPYSPVRLDITTTGAYTYTIPWWSRYIDVVLWAGGRGGKNAFSFARGNGGLGATPVGVILERGVDIPWTLATITGTVGTGGATNGGTGGGTTATSAGVGTLVATAPTGDNGSSQDGGAAGSLTVSGVAYTGGVAVTTGSGTPGSAPGGGGRGGNGSFFGDPGGAGARGQASFRARQT